MNDAIKRLEEWRKGNPERLVAISSPWPPSFYELMGKPSRDPNLWTCALSQGTESVLGFGDTIEAAINQALEAWEKNQ